MSEIEIMIGVISGAVLLNMFIRIPLLQLISLLRDTNSKLDWVLEYHLRGLYPESTKEFQTTHKTVEALRKIAE